MSFNSSSSYYFLASPFQGSEKEKAERYQHSLKATTFFLTKGISVFAPILYNQALNAAFDAAQYSDRRKLLMPMNLNFLYASNGLLLLKIKGWDESPGVQQYINVCQVENLAVFDLDPDDMEKTVDLIRAN
jgi:hypothetical protein